VQIVDLPLAGLKLLLPRVMTDARGSFVEAFHAPRFREAGIEHEFVQDNLVCSKQGTLRGLHYAVPAQAKLVLVTRGRTYDVAVDLRPESPTFGHWYGKYLDATEREAIFLPPGFAHGYCVTSETADVWYKVSSVYDAAAERQIRWNDPDLAVTWPVPEPLLSERDHAAESFRAFAHRMRAL
jgi:dTDP-4-dehydrorhamnose 3,5-epimerase